MKGMLRLSVWALALVSLFVMGTLPLSRSFAERADRVLVEYAPGQKAAVLGAIDRAGGYLHHEFDSLNVVAVTMSTADIDRLSRNPNVLSIEQDARRYPAGVTTGQAIASAQVIPYGITRVQAPEVWDQGFLGEGVTVCIIDTGLYPDHEDLLGIENVAGMSQVDDQWNYDGYGHGTHVAGTIAAVDNDLGVVGVSPGKVNLYIVKVFGNDGLWTTSSDLMAAAYTCAENGANIISMSLSGSAGPNPERKAFDALYEQGILSVAAASNDGNRHKAFPASYDSVISVAATDINNNVADFSNQNKWVELAAPGVGVLSTVPFVANTRLTVDGVEYSGIHMEYAVYGTASGMLVDGGLCTAPGDWAGTVVLCERGDTTFLEKVQAVEAGGGVAAVVYNNIPGEFSGTLGEPDQVAIVAISISQEDGQVLVANKLGVEGTVESLPPTLGSGYEAWGGTSMATPHVSGVAALLWSSNPNLTNVQIREAMDMTALDLGEPGRDIAYGYGLVQALDALTYLQNMHPGKGSR